MTDPINSKDLWDGPPSSEKSDNKELGHNARGGVLTVILAVAIIAGGFILPTLLYPYLDSYSDNPTLLASPADDIISGHVFEEPVTQYPWDVSDQAQLRSLTSYEMETLEQSGIADFLVSNMELRGIPLESSYEESARRILGEFRCLEPLDASQPGCFVLSDADIDHDSVPDVRCAVGLNGTLMSVLFVSDAWATLQLAAPLTISSEQIAEIVDDASATSSAESADAAAEATPAPTTPETTPPATPTEPAAPTASDASATYVPEVDNRPLQEEENIWLFSYVMSREVLLIGQMDVFSAFRQLDLSYEERFGYPFANLVAQPTEAVETLPEIERTTMTTHQLATGNQLLRIYDFSNDTRLILYIDSVTQICEGFSLSTMPL